MSYVATLIFIFGHALAISLQQMGKRLIMGYNGIIGKDISVADNIVYSRTPHDWILHKVQVDKNFLIMYSVGATYDMTH